ncbi:MAG TPA: nucleotidyltransferase domain-containing protein [Candidatus Babeliales bacterium]|nr:nucleotidyltransferase domain-containing protein [Candidatus Babeliales bacterium]
MTQLSHNVPQEETMVQLLTVLFPTATIYLFGSRARGDHTERSDIDVAIDLGREMELREVAKARGVLEGLNLPEKIDVVDMHSIPAAMKEFILKEGVLWKN